MHRLSARNRPRIEPRTLPNGRGTAGAAARGPRPALAPARAAERAVSQARRHGRRRRGHSRRNIESGDRCPWWLAPRARPAHHLPRRLGEPHDESVPVRAPRLPVIVRLDDDRLLPGVLAGEANHHLARLQGGSVGTSRAALGS